MNGILWEWIKPWMEPRRWMAFAVYSAKRDKQLFVAFPLNYVVALAWWLNDRWATAATAESWIEREVGRRLEAEKRNLYDMLRRVRMSQAKQYGAWVSDSQVVCDDCGTLFQPSRERMITTEKPEGVGVRCPCCRGTVLLAACRPGRRTG